MQLTKEIKENIDASKRDTQFQLNQQRAFRKELIIKLAGINREIARLESKLNTLELLPARIQAGDGGTHDENNHQLPHPIHAARVQLLDMRDVREGSEEDRAREKTELPGVRR